MPRFAINIEDERHAFVNMVAEKVSTIDKRRFCTFQVAHPLQKESYVIIDADDEHEASALVSDACMQIVGDITAILQQLQLPETCENESALILPDVSISEIVLHR